MDTELAVGDPIRAVPPLEGVIRVGWFKDKLLGSRPDKPTTRGLAGTNQAGLCDCCNAELDPAAGYYIATEDVVRSERYWMKEFAFAKKVLGDLMAERMFHHRVHLAAGDGSAWSICEDCSELFLFDRDVARSHAVRKSEPTASGPVNPAGCVLYAAQAWEQVFGHWPAGVEQPAVGDTCDLCRKKIYYGEFIGFVPRARMESYRAEGFVDNDPVRPPRPRGGDTGWVICRPCVARLSARFHRAGRRPDMSG